MPRTITHPALPKLKAQFPNVAFRVGEFRDQVTVVVPREVIRAVCTFLRDDVGTRFDQLPDLHAIDYKGFPGAAPRFAVNYLLTSIVENRRLTLKVFLDPTRATDGAQ